jgi:hypothetical protein
MCPRFWDTHPEVPMDLTRYAAPVVLVERRSVRAAVASTGRSNSSERMISFWGFI